MRERRSFSGRDYSFKGCFLRAELSHLVLNLRRYFGFRNPQPDMAEGTCEGLRISIYRSANPRDLVRALDHSELFDIPGDRPERASERQSLLQCVVSLVRQPGLLESNPFESSPLDGLRDCEVQRSARDLYCTGAFLSGLDSVTRVCKQGHRIRCPQHHAIAARVTGEIADVGLRGNQ